MVAKKTLILIFQVTQLYFFLFNSTIKSNLTVIFEGLKVTGTTNKKF